MQEDEGLKQSSKLLRNLLGSIDLSDIKETLADEEAKARDGDVETFYNSIFKRQLKIFIQEQLEFMGKQAENTTQFTFGRGTINAFLMIDDWMKDKRNASLSKFDEVEKEEI